MLKINDMLHPTSLAEALDLLAEHPKSMAIAGGTDIIPRLHKSQHIESLKHGGAQPMPVEERILLNIFPLKELRGIEIAENQLQIGATTTHHQIADDPLVRRYLPMLAEAAAIIGSVQIRNRGTIGGNLANASPAADLAGPCIALSAQIRLASRSAIREVAAESFATAPGQTMRRPDEIITALVFRLPPPDSAQFFRRLAPRQAQGIAKVSVAFYSAIEDGSLRNPRIALGAVGPAVILAHETAAFLDGKSLSPESIQEACRKVQTEVHPISDIRSTAEYRRAMTAELLRRGLEEIAARNRAAD